MTACPRRRAHGPREAGAGRPSTLRRLDDVWPDIAILDIGLPGMDGSGQDSDVRRALAAGFDRHIAKPVGLGTLQELCRTLGGQHACRN